MKKISLLFAATAMATGAFALPSYVMFSSEGPDKYADGTTVLDGEVYALVWKSNTATDAMPQFKDDGTISNTDSFKVVSAAPIATSGHCPTVMYMLTGANAALPSTGTFSVYLLDTRKTTTTAAGETQLTSTVGGVNKDGTMASFNVALQVTDSMVGGSSTSVGAVASTAPIATSEKTPNPTITAMQISGSTITVNVGNTMPYLKYTITGSESVAGKYETLAEGVPGAADLKLQADVSDCRFFKVTRDAGDTTK